MKIFPKLSPHSRLFSHTLVLTGGRTQQVSFTKGHAPSRAGAGVHDLCYHQKPRGVPNPCPCLPEGATKLLPSDTGDWKCTVEKEGHGRILRPPLSAPLLTPKLWQRLFAEVIRTWKSRMMSGFPHSFVGNGRVGVGVGVGVWRIEQGNHSLHVTVAACKISIMLGFSFFVPLQEREGLCWNMGDAYPSIFLSLVSPIWTSTMKRNPGNLRYPHSCCQVMHKARASSPVLDKAATAE